MQRVAEGVIYLHAGAGVPGGCAAWYRSWAVVGADATPSPTAEQAELLFIEQCQR